MPQNNEAQFSPGSSNVDLKDTSLNILHSNCAKKCLELDDCKTSESYAKGDLFYCECSDCSNYKRPITFFSEDRINFYEE